MTRAPLQFARAELRFELSTRSHPLLREELYAFATWSEAGGLPPPFVTGLGRDEETNRRVNGHPESWHLFDCAGDLRSWIYAAEQLEKVMTYWRGRKLAAKKLGKHLELLYHDAGTGSHVHVAVRDPNWKATYLNRKAP